MDSYYIVNVEAAIYKNDTWLIVQRSTAEKHTLIFLKSFLCLIEPSLFLKFDENSSDRFANALQKKLLDMH